MLDGEAVKELDRDVAEQYYIMNELDVPQPYKPENIVPKEAEKETEMANDTAPKSKKVKFADIDEDVDYASELELNKLRDRIWELTEENEKLQEKLK